MWLTGRAELRLVHLLAKLATRCARIHMARHPMDPAVSPASRHTS
jgi:hypothetical protein